MRVLVIGGTRFMGPHVVRELVSRGCRVTVFHRGESEPDLPVEVEHLHHPARSLGDRGFYEDYGAEFRRIAPDVVLDMIPMTEADARTLMHAFRGIARRVVVAGSQDVYRAYDIVRGRDPGPPEPVPLTEESPLRRRLYPYRDDPPKAADDPHRWTDDYDKIAVERVVMGDPALPGTVLRLPAVYGPGDGQHRLFPYLKRMDDGRPAILLDERWAGWRWSRSYVENAARALALAVTDERAASRVFNVAEPEAMTEADWVRRIGRAAGWDGRVIPVPTMRLPVPRERLPRQLVQEGDPSQDLVADSGRLRRELGYAEPVPPDEALRRTIAWERVHAPERFDPADFDYDAEDAVLALVGDETAAGTDL